MSNHVVATSSVILSLLAGCAVAPSDEPAPPPPPAHADVAHAAVIDDQAADRAFHLITTIAVGDEHTLSIYEPSPGRIVYGEHGRSPQQPVTRTHRLDRLPPVEVFRLLAPGTPVPAELVAAQAREEARAADHGVPTRDLAPLVSAPESSADAPAPALGPRMLETDGTGPCPSDWFQQNFCTTVGYNWCLLNWWNGAYANGGNLWHATAAVCPFYGDVGFSVSTSDGGGGTWSVGQGYYRRFWESAGTNFWGQVQPFSFHSTVFNASGKGFQFAGQLMTN